MTNTTMSQLSKPVDSLRTFRVGAWCWIATGVGHSAGDIFMRTFPRAETRAIEDLMREHPFNLMGMHRTYYEVTMGFSLAMGACMVFVGVLLLYIARLASDQHHRPAALLGLVMSAITLGISAWLEPPPPIVLFSVACIAFGLAVRTAGSGELSQ